MTPRAFTFWHRCWAAYGFLTLALIECAAEEYARD